MYLSQLHMSISYRSTCHNTIFDNKISIYVTDNNYMIFIDNIQHTLILYINLYLIQLNYRQTNPKVINLLLVVAIKMTYLRKCCDYSFN